MLGSIDKRRWFRSCVRQYSDGTLGNRMGRSLFIPSSTTSLPNLFQVMQWFLFATILQGLLLLLLLYSNIVLLIYHPPDASRPLDTALIHAPLRFFLILPLSILLPLCLLLAFSFIFITYYLLTNVQCHSRSNILPNAGWSTRLLLLACYVRFRRPLGYKPPRARRRHYSR